MGALGAYSIGIGGIVGGGIFATLGLAVADSRGSAWLSFLVSGLVALLTAYSYCKLSIAFPSKGGTIAFLKRGLGEGFLSGRLSTFLVLSYVVIMALYAHAFATYATAVLPPEARHLESAIAGAVILIIGFANLARPAAMGAVEGALNVLKLLVLGVFVVLGLLHPGLSLTRLGAHEWVGPVDIFVTGMLVFLSYEGFELIANASPQVKNPARALPIAFFGSVLSAMLLYVLIVVVTLGHMSFDGILQQQSHAISAVAETFMGRSGFWIMAVGAMVASSSAINADFFGSSKLVEMLAEEGPRAWRRAHGILGHHPAGMLFLMALGLIAATTLDLHALSAVSSAGFLIVFAAVNAANAKLAVQTGSRREVSILGAATCLAALAAMMVQLAGKEARRYEVYIIVGMAALPFLIEAGDALARKLFPNLLRARRH